MRLYVYCWQDLILRGDENLQLVTVYNNIFWVLIAGNTLNIERYLRRCLLSSGLFKDVLYG